MKLTLRHMAAFDAVARLASLGKAAESLALSPSAVSMALKELEQILGAPLFHRDQRRLVLNENGRRLQPEARSLLRHAERIERGTADRPLEGVLRIGASSTIGTYLAPAVVGRFLTRYPGVQVQLSTLTSMDVIDGIEAMTFDVGFIEAPTVRTTLHRIPWSGDRLVVFAAAGHKLAGRTVGLDALADATWCTQPFGSFTRMNFFKFAVDRDQPTRIGFETANIEAIKRTVREGAVLGCLSELAVQPEFARGELAPVHVRGFDFARPFHLVTSTRVYQGDLQRAFVALASEMKPAASAKQGRRFRKSK